MTDDRADFRRQMQRQSTWLKESLLWIVDTKIMKNRGLLGGRPTALDVGCGPGFVMEIMKQRMEVKGVDIDTRSVEDAKSIGLDASVAAGERLPLEDDSFDLVYCTFLLLWVKDPSRVVSEMKRVSRKWVACLAEPDYGGRISFPDSVRAIDELVVNGISREGGDPFIGRKLNSIFAGCGMAPEVGIHPGIWNIAKLRAESDDEWRWIKMTVAPQEVALDQLRKRWDAALDEGTLFQYNPIFYAVAEK
jgi:SAM-dependent methyltransferase